MGKKSWAIRFLAQHKALDSATIGKLMKMEDGGPGSGNFGHKGRPGKVGGSSKEGGSGGVPSAKSLKEGEEIRINTPVGKNQVETQIFRRSKTNPNEFEHEVRTPGRGKLATGQVNENFVNQVLSKTKPEEIEYGGSSAAKESEARANIKARGTMKEPPYGPAFGVKHGSLKRDTKASEDELERFRNMVKDKDQTTVYKETWQYLKDMKPGTAFRFDEPSKKGQYDWMIKQPDGKFLFTNKMDGSQVTLYPQDVANDIAIFGYPEQALGEFCVPEEGASDNDAFWTAKRRFANLKPNAGDRYKGKRVPLEDSIQNCSDRAAGKISYPKENGNASAGYTKVQRDSSGKILSAGKPVGNLTNGSGVTGIDRGDISNENPDKLVYNTLGEHCVEDANGNLVLTPEREELHQQIVNDLLKDAKKPANGKKVATFLGGGSAAGKGTIQGTESGVNFPSRIDSPVLDADAIKEMLPEYVDTAFSDDHENAASYAHEESSALVKRAMQAAMANGYSYTLDGTGDGSLKSMQKKINEARANGYEVNGVYVTCPTEKAVERSIGRSKTDKFGRLVKPETVRHIHEEVSRLFPDVAPLMDHCELYDTDQGGRPVLIATCKRGGPIEPVKGREHLYEAFLAKNPKYKKNV